MDVEASWFTRVVDRLRELRADGYGFDTAWSTAMHELPPSVSDSGGWRPQLAINGDETVVGFFRQACESAWRDVRAAGGNGPALQHFHVEMLRDEDAASSGRPAGGSKFRRAA